MKREHATLVTLTSVALVCFLMGALAGSLLIPKPQSEPQASMRSYMVPVLILEARDADGNIVQTYRKEGDPPTVNFIILWMTHVLWSRTSNKVLHNTTATDAAGTVRTIAGSSGTDNRIWDAVSVTGVADQGVKIMVGDGTTAFDVTQFRLQGAWTADVLMNTFICFRNSTHLWSQYRGSWTNNLGAARTVSECGLFLNFYWGATTTNAAWFMVFRDTFTGISVPNGGSLTITYQIFFRFA